RRRTSRPAPPRRSPAAGPTSQSIHPEGLRVPEPFYTEDVFFGDPIQFIIAAIFLIPGLVLGLVLHEAAHAAVAVARGDQTPRLDGRLSLNPSHHLDPLGTIAVLLVHFGWAKPVRINPSRMRHRFDPA